MLFTSVGKGISRNDNRFDANRQEESRLGRDLYGRLYNYSYTLMGAVRNLATTTNCMKIKDFSCDDGDGVL